MIKQAEERYTRDMEQAQLVDWKENNIFKKGLRLRQSGTPFYLMFGPPYASGYIHTGTALNAIIKDAFCRYKAMRGYDVFSRPGFDMHGLPIEQKVEKKLGLSKDQLVEYGIPRYIADCKAFAIEQKQAMIADFEQLGVFFDFEDAYETITPEHIYTVWDMIKKADEKGLLYPGKYPVHVCPKCQTTEAYNELEYVKKKDRSIYIRFPLADRPDTFLLVWTTTPWTLPANTGIMVHPTATYVEVKHGNETLIMAKDLVETVMSKAGIPSDEYSVVREFKGAELEGAKYTSPLVDVVPAQQNLDNGHRVITSDRYVTTEDGTGLVHTAPGHGLEDYDAGTQAGLPLLSPVNIDGTLDDSTGKFAGMYVFDANPKIIDYLSEQGYLFHEEYIEHDYPTCWRCHTPLIMLSLPNWFIKASVMRENMAAANRAVQWVPDWARARFADWVENLGDWPISRQRYWGIPLPIWVCDKCGAREVIGSLDELRQKAEVPANFDPHIPYVDDITWTCSCGGTMRRIKDILDVWADSSVTSWAALDYVRDKSGFERYWPADLNIEARDQIRGWWNSQMIASLITHGRAPYKTILMHGFVLSRGKVKMSKSASDNVTPKQLCDEYGTDAVRLYLLSIPPGTDFVIDYEKLKLTKRTVSVFWNVYRFISTYMALDNYTPSEDTGTLRIEDKWILSRLQKLTRTVTSALDQYDSSLAVPAIMDYILEDLSRWYVKLIRSRVWSEADNPDKRAVYYTTYTVLTTLAKLLSPFMPFVTESIYNNLVRGVSQEAPESVYLTDWPSEDSDIESDEIEAQMTLAKQIVESTLSARQSAKLRLRWPIDKIVVASDADNISADVAAVQDIIQSQANAKDLEIVSLAHIASTEGYEQASFAKGVVLIPKELSPELFSEAMAREVIRRVQSVRKQLRLKETDRIRVEVVSDKDFLGVIRPQESLIAKETRADAVLLSEAATLNGTKDVVELQGHPVELIVARD